MHHPGNPLLWKATCSKRSSSPFSKFRRLPFVIFYICLLLQCFSWKRLKAMPCSQLIHFNKLSCWRDHSEAGSHKFMLFTTHTHARARTLSQHTHKHTHEQVAKNVCSVLRIQQWKEKKLCPCRLMLSTKDKPTVSRTQQCSWTKNTFQSVSWVPFCGVNKSPRCLAAKTGLLPGIVLLTLVRARLGETICYLSFPVSVADHTSVSN